VLDPVFDAGSGPSAAELAEIGGTVFGNFADLVFAASVTHQTTFDIYGWSEGRTWIVVRGRNLEGRSAQSLLQAWIQAVERPRSPVAARAAARALASSGWPAAVEWLDERWRDLQDGAALDGLILAAGRGALARSLASRQGAQLLLERADRALATVGEASREARETARALITIGTIGSESWSGGFAAASVRARGLRCALVGATRSCPAELAKQLEARLLAADTPPQERFASLRALGSFARPRSGELEIPGIEAAFEWAVSTQEGRFFPVALRAVGGREPPAWNTASGLSPQARAVLCADALARFTQQTAPVAGARLAGLLAQDRGEELLLEVLDRESLSSPSTQLRAGLLAARSAGADAAKIARLLVCAGLDLPEEGRALADEIFSRPEWSDADWRAAGASIARVGGALDLWPRKETPPDEHYADFLARLGQVRDGLLATPDPKEGMDAGWVQGCERAFWILHARQDEPSAREFLRRLRVLFQRVQHPMRLELTARRFPPPPPSILVDLEAREPWIGF
ncbi:MAG TPA: hypothetical protein VK843_05610, partial [Planctomycetota bacterium]|nr:hypothetical protein [Planctomycetota bacterium]